MREPLNPFRRNTNFRSVEKREALVQSPMREAAGGHRWPWEVTLAWIYGIDCSGRI
jgi:hypothetical protein